MDGRIDEDADEDGPGPRSQRGSTLASDMADGRLVPQRERLRELRAAVQRLLALPVFCAGESEPRTALDQECDLVRAGGAACVGKLTNLLSAIDQLDLHACELAGVAAAFGDDLPGTLDETAAWRVGEVLMSFADPRDRTYRLVDPSGGQSDVVLADLDVLRLSDRSLAIDQTRHRVWRRGACVADLRRRTLLRSLLFLLAAQPRRLFAKEDIVRTVWGVDYHPLRHDPSLFTTVMRIRRLLGADGRELLESVGDGCYRFSPPPDFLFVFWPGQILTCATFGDSAIDDAHA